MKCNSYSVDRNSTVATDSSTRQSSSESTSLYADNRSESITHQYNETMFNSSPQVMQTKVIQKMASNSSLSQNAVQLQTDVQSKHNRTGMPDNLKSGIESLSGMNMSDVKVHYNSSKPAQLNALAYAQGTDIHLGKGQEKHLPHEAWHVVQQKQGKVMPTISLKSGLKMNTDSALETEADKYGAMAAQMSPASYTNPQSENQTLSNKSFNPVVQRNVGFEFELLPEVKTYKSGRVWGYNSLAKGTRILNGIDFYVEADGLPGGESSWEFVTTDFPETMLGLVRLLQALNNIDGIVSILRNSPLVNYPNMNHNQVDNNFAAFATPVNNRYFSIEMQDFRTKPQVTAGFALDALDELFNSATTAAGPGVSDLMQNVNSMQVHGQVVAPQLDVPLGNMRTEAGNAIGVAVGNPPDPALRGLVTQIMQIIVAGRQNIGATPKTIMRLVLGRTDLKASFATLPAPIRGPFEANPGTFVTMVMNAVNAHLGLVLNNAHPVISGALFTDPMYANDNRHNMASPFTQVSLAQWLTSIATVGGQDMLSQGHYPVRTNMFGRENRTDRKANAILDSMGALHNTLDPGNRPVFEIRSSKAIFASLITSYALDFFKYVRYLHNPGALTESAELSGLAALDVAAIVGFDPNRALLLQQMRARALANFNN